MVHPKKPLPYSYADFINSARAVLLDFAKHEGELKNHWGGHVWLFNQSLKAWDSGYTKKAKKLETKMLSATSSKTVFYLLQMPFDRQKGEYVQVKYSDILPAIQKVDPRLRSGEYVRAFLLPKSSGGWRPVASFGYLQKANQLACRILFECRHDYSPFEYNRADRGPELAISEIATAIEKEGHTHVAIIDIKDAFGSLIREAILKMNLLPESLVMNTMFIHDDTKIKGIEKNYKMAVRLGLPQGSMVSGIALQKFLERIFLKLEFDGIWCYTDDILIVAKTREEASERLAELEALLTNLSTGPLILRSKNIYKIGEPMNYLGYWFSRSKTGKILVRPSNEGYRRSYVKAARKLMYHDPEKWEWITFEHFCNWSMSKKLWLGRLDGAAITAAVFQKNVMPALYNSKLSLISKRQVFSNFKALHDHFLSSADDCVPSWVVEPNWRSAFEGDCRWK